MSTTSKSPLAVVAVALEVGRRTLKPYSHRCSPRVFTQPQLFACLVLQVFEGKDYRGVEALLADLPGLAQAIGLRRVPDHSTLHYAAQRFFGAGCSDELLAASVRLMMGRKRVVKLAAADSTGLESGHASAYFVRRRQRGQKGAQDPLYQTTTYTRFPKLTLLVDCRTHQALAMLAGRGPRPDVSELRPLLGRLPAGLSIARLLADAGFDSEANHRLLREEHGIAGLIPPRWAGPPRAASRPPAGGGGGWAGCSGARPAGARAATRSGGRPRRATR